MNLDISTKQLQYGQKKPYADKTTETVVTVMVNGEPAIEVYALQYTRFLLAPGMLLKEDRDTSTLDAYSRSYIDELTYLGDGKVFIRTAEPYID